MGGQQQIETVTAGRQPRECTMTSWDGTQVFYRVWPAKAESSKALLLFHRGHEHSGRFQDLVDRLELDDYWMFAWDARGHGRTDGERGYAPSIQAVVRDVNSFVRHIAEKYNVPVENMALIANSLGAVLVSTWVHDYAPPVRALVLATPALRVKLYVPLAVPALRAMQWLRGKSFVKSYVRPTMLTHDAEMARQYAEDPLISRNIAVNTLLDMHDTATRIMADASAIRTPTLVLSAGSDWVVKVPPQRRFFEALSSPTKAMQVYDGFYHAIFHEKERQRPIARIRQFLVEVFDNPPQRPSLLDADKHGATYDAYERLRKPLAPFSSRGLYFGAIRLVLKTLGRLSEGVCIGWQTGFNSGESLDYVYRNEAKGRTPLGRLADRLYLSGAGWRGIRQRKVHIKQLLKQAIHEVHDAGRPVRLLDIASGPGRYVMETVKALPEVEMTAVLRDRNKEALESGRKLAEDMHLVGVTHEPGDAFDERALGATDPRPNVAIVSGLYELFPENDKVTASLRGLGATVEEGGYLIYTNQPWHPQLELIARSLVGMDGKPWIMRCRTQEEMDELVAAAGFQKIDMLADESGIFTVSLARRVACS